MRDANTEALNRYQNKLAKQEKAFELFCDEIDDDLVELSEMIEHLKKIAKDYKHYDFTEELEDIIRENLWVKK